MNLIDIFLMLLSTLPLDLHLSFGFTIVFQAFQGCYQTFWNLNFLLIEGNIAKLLLIGTPHRFVHVMSFTMLSSPL